MVGMFGASGAALRRGHRQRGELAVLDLRQRRIEIVEQDLDIAGERSLQRRAGAAERHMDHLQAGQLQEPGAGEVRALPDAGGGVGELVRIGLDIGDQFPDRLDAGRRMRRHDIRNPDQVGDRLQLVRLVGHVAEDAVGDRVGAGIADQDGVSVRPCCARLRRCRWCRRRRSGSPRPRTGPTPSADARPATVPSRRWCRRRRRHDETDGLGRPPVGAVARARQDRRR